MGVIAFNCHSSENRLYERISTDFLASPKISTPSLPFEIRNYLDFVKPLSNTTTAENMNPTPGKGTKKWTC